MNILAVYKRFPTEADCVAYLEQIRWQGKPTCPYCGSARITPGSAERRHHCNNCNTTFSVTVGTPFHHTHLPLQKWFFAIYLILSARNGISARQLTRHVGINKNTAWYLAMRIRKAVMEPSQRSLLQKIDSDLFDLANSLALGAKP
jgi:transposase-like protein